MNAATSAALLLDSSSAAEILDRDFFLAVEDCRVYDGLIFRNNAEVFSVYARRGTFIIARAKHGVARSKRFWSIDGERVSAASPEALALAALRAGFASLGD